MLHRPSNPDIEDIRRMMERVGWVDVEVRVGCVPVGACSRARGSERLEVVGRLALSAIVLGFPSYGTALFTRVLGWEFEDAERLFEACRRELEGMEDCWSERWHFLGRKPEADSWDGLVGGVGGLVIDEKMRD